MKGTARFQSEVRQKKAKQKKMSYQIRKPRTSPSPSPSPHASCVHLRLSVCLSVSFFLNLNILNLRDLSADICNNASVPRCSVPTLTSMYRTVNGVCNNEKNSLWGVQGTPFNRILPACPRPFANTR